MKSGDAAALAVAVGAPLILGNLSGLAVMGAIKGWYAKLKKPKWNPPNWVFPVVWPILYTAQGVASFLVWRVKGDKRVVPLSLYGAQLLLNIAYSPLFFKLHRPKIAAADSAALLGVATAATVTMAQAAGSGGPKVAVISLMSPYLAWVTFATLLTAKIAIDNPEAHKIEDDAAAPATTSKSTKQTKAA